VAEVFDEAAVLKLFSDTPFLHGFHKTRKEFIFPMSVEEVWLAFFCDDPLYGINEAMETLGDRFELIEEWHAFEKPMFNGIPVLQERMMRFKTQTPPNPIVDYAWAETHQYMREGRSETRLVIDEFNHASGFIYADTFNIYTRWEIYSPSTDSQVSALRHSWKIEWVSEPLFVGNIIYGVA
jgi:hypothetical protein